MSERSRNLPRRSCFSTPGSNERFLEKAPTVPADMSFLDLEDSVAPLEKDAARAKVVEAIRKQSWDDRVLCVRINAWDTEWTYGDVIEVVGNAGDRLDELMLPKVQSAAEVVALDLLLTQVEKRSGLPVGHIGIEAQIETTRGLINVDEICAASPRLETIIFGPADFAASMEMPVLTGGVQIPEYPGDHFHYVFSRILMAGRANGLQVIDGPYLKVKDMEGLRDFSQRTRILGYDGKWALTPDQVDRAQRALLPDPGAVRPGLGHPRRLPAGHRERAQGCRHVRRRDDRRGQPQDGHQVRHPRDARRPGPFERLRALPATGRRPAPRTQPARSTSRRATTFSANVSSAPSKIDRTRASTKYRLTAYSSAYPIPPWICMASRVTHSAARHT